MKKSILFLFFFAALASVAVGQNANDWFITRWIAPADGTIRFPAIGSGYTIRYVPINHITGAPIGAMQTISPATSHQIISGLNPGWMYRIYAFGGLDRILISPGNRDYIVAIEQWGTTVWSSWRNAFAGCRNMDVIANDVPNLSVCQDLSAMFYDCTSLVNANGSMANWQTQNIRTMDNMFSGATSFNQPIGSWNTQNVQLMAFMFKGATSFNQPIGNWNVSKVNSMVAMFNGATSFNQPIGGWNTATLGSTDLMFSYATSFNQPIDNWNTTMVYSTKNMFSGATSFNQSLVGFEINNIPSGSYNMTGMLSSCGMDCQNLSATLDSWKTQAQNLNKNNIDLGHLNINQYYNATGQAAINALKARGWTINGGTLGSKVTCALATDWFETRWIIPASGAIKFPATSNGYTIKYEPINHITGAPIGRSYADYKFCCCRTSHKWS